MLSILIVEYYLHSCASWLISLLATLHVMHYHLHLCQMLTSSNSRSLRFVKGYLMSHIESRNVITGLKVGGN